MNQEVKEPLTEQKVQKSALKIKLKNFLVRMKNNHNIGKNKRRQKINKVKGFFKKEIILQLVFHGIIYGAILNYVLWVVFHIPFKWYGFPAYGIFLYLIKSEFMQIWRDIWFKGEQ